MRDLFIIAAGVVFLLALCRKEIRRAFTGSSK
jgi:hypothetical protein